MNKIMSGLAVLLACAAAQGIDAIAAWMLKKPSATEIE
jgi:hypothetical protein